MKLTQNCFDDVAVYVCQLRCIVNPNLDVQNRLLWRDLPCTYPAHHQLESAITIIVINMNCPAVQAGKVYRWQIVEAAIMKWVHLGFDKPGCVMGLVSRDANYLNSIPRLTKDVVVVAANR